jgi:hypothetical protein
MGLDKIITRAIVFLEKKPGIIVHGAALFFLIAGLIYSIHLGDYFRFPDEIQYYTLAKNLAEGHGYTLDGVKPSAYLPPGYPIFLSLFVKFGASPVFLRYLNFIALALCVYITRAILRRENAEAGAALSSLLLVGYGVLFYTAGTLYTQTMLTLVLMLVFWLTTGPHFSYLHAVIFGLLSAFMVMLTSASLFVPPLIVFWMFFPNKWHIIRKATVSALIVIACFSMWTYRNYKAFDAFIPMTNHGWDTFYTGNNPNVTVTAWHTSMPKEIIDEAYSLNEVEREAFYKKKVLKFWKENPGGAIKLYLLKLLNHFNFQNKFYIKSQFNRLKSFIMFVTYYPLLICLLARLFFIPKVRLSKVEVLFVLVYIASALFYAIFITRIRFRLPYDSLLIVHIGIMFSLVLNWIKSRQGRSEYLKT